MKLIDRQCQVTSDKQQALYTLWYFAEGSYSATVRSVGTARCYQRNCLPPGFDSYVFWHYILARIRVHTHTHAHTPYLLHGAEFFLRS